MRSVIWRCMCVVAARASASRDGWCWTMGRLLRWTSGSRPLPRPPTLRTVRADGLPTYRVVYYPFSRCGACTAVRARVVSTPHTPPTFTHTRRLTHTHTRTRTHTREAHMHLRLVFDVTGGAIACVPCVARIHAAWCGLIHRSQDTSILRVPISPVPCVGSSEVRRNTAAPPRRRASRVPPRNLHPCSRAPAEQGGGRHPQLVHRRRAAVGVDDDGRAHVQEQLQAAGPGCDAANTVSLRAVTVTSCGRYKP